DAQLPYKGNLADDYQNLGIIYETMREYERAKENYLKSLDINLKIGVFSKILQNYENLSFLYEKKKDYPKAIDYREKMIEVDRKAGFMRIYRDQEHLKRLNEKLNQ
nr:tetratricopeptide repeat protein [Candidatus Mcinerneyibacteriales bacterium]